MKPLTYQSQNWFNRKFGEKPKFLQVKNGKNTSTHFASGFASLRLPSQTASDRRLAKATLNENS